MSAVLNTDATNPGAAGTSTFGQVPGCISNEQFLAAVFSDIDPGTHALCVGFPGDPGNFRAAAAPWVPGERLPQRIARDHNNYVAGCTFHPNAQGERWERTTALHAAQRLIMIDDIGTGLGSKIPWNKLKLPPSALIESSRDNHQADYFITQDADAHDRALCARLIGQLITHGLIGKDTGMAGVNRVARLPVGINGKAKYAQDGHPWRVRCIEFEPARRYTIKQIAAAYGLDLTAPPESARAAIQLTPALRAGIDRRFAALLKAFSLLDMYKRETHAGWHEVRCPWIDEHSDPADSGAYLMEPGDANDFEGWFKCYHGCCDERRLADVHRWLLELRAERASQRAEQ